jgi:hypothetical protein
MNSKACFGSYKYSVGPKWHSLLKLNTKTTFLRELKEKAIFVVPGHDSGTRVANYQKTDSIIKSKHAYKK